MTDRARLSADGYAPGQIQEGELWKQCPITGDTYRVTKWVDKEDGRVVALQKERVDDE